MAGHCGHLCPVSPDSPTRDELQAARCWFPDTDRVPGDPDTTTWKRTARLRQARWREQCGYPIGVTGGPKSRPIGSRIDLNHAKDTGANFLTPNVLAAVRARLAAPERFQMLKEDRLCCDLLSSMPMCFNLFGELAADNDRARRAVRAWWPDAPAGRVLVRFEHSPGRRDAAFLNNQSAFDVAFEIDQGNAKLGIVGVETKYHEHAAKEKPPNKGALGRYEQVTERAGVFTPGWREKIIGTDLQQIWLDHLLVLSMLQHPSRRWTWGRFVLVYPSENPSFRSAAGRYQDVLMDTATFESRTVEELLDAPGVLPGELGVAFRDRYL